MAETFLCRLSRCVNSVHGRRAQVLVSGAAGRCAPSGCSQASFRSGCGATQAGDAIGSAVLPVLSTLLPLQGLALPSVTTWEK